MLPFTPIRGFTLFPKTQCSAGSWTGLVEIVSDDRVVRFAVCARSFSSEERALADAFEEAAVLANILEASF